MFQALNRIFTAQPNKIANICEQKPQLLIYLQLQAFLFMCYSNSFYNYFIRRNMLPNNIFELMTYYNFWVQGFQIAQPWNFVETQNLKQQQEIQTFNDLTFSPKTDISFKNIEQSSLKECKTEKKKKLVDEDDDWNPKKKKKSLLKGGAQREDRNASSNIIRCFLKFLSTKEANQMLFHLKKKFQTSIQNCNQIVKWLQYENINHRNYVRMKTINKLIMRDRSRSDSISLVFSMLYVSYSKSNLRAHFLTSIKLKRSHKPFMLSRIRQLEQSFECFLYEDNFSLVQESEQ